MQKHDREYLLKVHAEQQNQLDKTLLLIATGGISFGFYLVRDGLLTGSEFYFRLSICAFVISIIFGITSFFFSVNCCKKLLFEEDDTLHQNLVTFSNATQLITVLLGICFALIFFISQL